MAIDCKDFVVNVPIPSRSCSGAESPGAEHDAIERALDGARAALIPVAATFSIAEDGARQDVSVTRRSFGPLVYDRDDIERNLTMYVMQVDDTWRDYPVIVAAPRLHETGFPDFGSLSAIPLRIDSGCMTGQIFGDRTCECRDQLDAAIKYIAKNHGIVVAIPGQDGRGFGVDFKVATLGVQLAGLHTVDAARALSGATNVDRRTYGGVVAVLRMLGLGPGTALKILTNNRDKIEPLVENGYVIAERVPLVIESTRHTTRHLAAKRDLLGHLL